MQQSSDLANKEMHYKSCVDFKYIPWARHLSITTQFCKRENMSITETNYGLIRKAAGIAELQRIPVPTLPDDYLLIRVAAVAVNPTDWTTLDAAGDNGTLVGCDWAGTVEEVGPKVEKAFKKGDRVAGCAHGGELAQELSTL